MADSKLNATFEDVLDFDEDKNTLIIPPQISLSSNQLSSMNNNTLNTVKKLDLSFAAQAKKTDGTHDLSMDGIQEQQLLVVFELPDGSQGEYKFKLGQTVEFVKSYVEIEFGIPMAEQKLYVEDKQLLNPFSLLDYPETKGVEELYIRVEGDLPDRFKK